LSGSEKVSSCIGPDSITRDLGNWKLFPAESFSKKMVLLNVKSVNGGKARKRRGKVVLGARRKGIARSQTAARAMNVRTGGFAGIERKFVDATRAQNAFTTAWAQLAPSAGITNCISAPGIGTGEEQRDGRVFTIRSIHVKGFVTFNVVEAQAAPPADMTWRICVVWDTQSNGAAIAGTSVMDAGATNDVLAFRNLQNSKRFIVLYDSGPRVLKHMAQTNEGAVNTFAAPA